MTKSPTPSPDAKDLAERISQWAVREALETDVDHIDLGGALISAGMAVLSQAVGTSLMTQVMRDAADAIDQAKPRRFEA